MTTEEIYELVERQAKAGEIPSYLVLTGQYLRGGKYMEVFKERVGSLVLMAIEIIRQKQKLSIADVATLVPRIGLPVKTTFEFLEYAEILPSGTWDRLADRGLTASLINQLTTEK